MSAKKPAAEDHCNTETDEGTAAAIRKRSRRVSFAEITSVHVFDRDDEFETPPDPKPNPEHDDELEQFNRDLGFLGGDENLRDEEQEEDEDGDEVEAGRLFLRPAGSPASTAGSATSNDEDNFFGPVSTSFIRPGRLSDSGVSDSHDITMDSTAFSQHFRSLVKSDSEGDLKTPTGVHLSLEENTPSQKIIPGSNMGSSMLLNSAKKPMSASSTSFEKLSDGSDSNDMSLVEDNPKRYDYGRLSFGWDPLLVEGVEDLDTDKIVPMSNKNIITQSPIHPQSRISPSKKRRRERMELNDSGDENLGPTDNDHMVVDIAPLADRSDDANGHSESTEPNHTRNENLSHTDSDHVMAEVAPFADKLDDAKGHRESMELNDSGSEKLGHRDTEPMMVEVAPLADGFVGANGDYSSSPIHHPIAMSTDDLNRSSDLLIKGMLSTEESDASETRPKADSHVENSDTQESKEPQLDAFLQQLNKSPLARSLSSLSKRRQTVFKGSRVSNTFLTSTPQNYVFSETDGIGRRAETVPSVQKSISKLRMLDASPFASNLNVEMNSMLISSESLYRTPPHNSSLYRNKEDDEIKHMDASAAWRDQSRIVAQEDMNTLSNMKLNSVYSAGAAGIAKYGTSPVPRSTEVLASEQSYDLARVRSLVSQLTWSGKKTKMNLLASEDPTGRIAVTPGKNSFFTKIALDHEKIMKAVGTPYVHSLEESVVKKSVSKEFQGITSEDDESKNTIIDQGYNVDTRENVRNVSLSATIAKELDSLFMEISHTGSPVLEINHLKGSTGLQNTSSLEIKYHDVQDETRLEGSAQTCLTNEESGCLILNENLDTEKGPVLKKDLTGECMVSSPPSVDKKLLESSRQSPSRKGFYNTARDDKLNSAALGKPLLPDANQLTYEYEDLSARKRIREGVTSRERVSVDEIDGLQRSPKVHKSVGREFEVLPGHQNRSNVETFTVGHKPTLSHWTDVFSKFLAKKTLPPSTDKLNLQAIGVLEERLVKLQRLQTYQMHHNVIHSQKSLEDRANLQHKSRTAETKTMLLIIMHEHAKLQIMRLKQERLQRNVQLLRHGIQESRLLKLNSLPHISAGCNRDANFNGSHCQSINIRGREEEKVPGDKATELRQLRDTLESKLTSLTKSVHSSCKLKGILSHIDTVSAINGYLKKKACCKFLSSNAQLWKVHNILTMNGNRSLTLNYLDFVIKRITKKAGAASSVVISNELSDGAMMKSFPNMEASTALSFALNAIATQKYFGSPSLTQEIQMTNSVLGNLIDVTEEIQQARFELQNLTCTRFVSPSVGQLDLNFHFIGMRSGRKLALTLDMSCLKWGIYPSDIMPYKLEASSELSPESLPEQLSAEIRAAVQSLSDGYWRILRICKTVSQVVQAWSR